MRAGQGILSNRLGYLGGYGWAVLCARVCVEYPQVWIDAARGVAGRH
jgi:poly(A) polymerase Pap1